MSASDYSDETLLRRAVGSAFKLHGKGWHPRWVAIMETFLVGRPTANEICQRFGFDPDEQIRRPK